MTLSRVESIHCDEVDGNVLVRGLYGEKEITALGQFANRESVEMAPSECPLLPSDYNRWVGRFNACLECPRATVNMPEVQTEQ